MTHPTPEHPASGSADAATPASGGGVSRRTALGAGAALAAAAVLPVWGSARSAPVFASPPPTILAMTQLLSTPPFSFTYDGVASTTLLPTWPKTTATATQPDGRIRRTVTWTAPDGLKVVWVGDEYPGHTTLSWTVTFTKTGTGNSKQLTDVLALDVTVDQLPATDWALHTARGSFWDKGDFTPLDLSLPTGSYRVFTTAGGRPTDGRNLLPERTDWEFRSGPLASGAPGYLGSDQHVTGAAGARARFTFHGTSVSWIGARHIDCGIAQVVLDGVQVATVDLYATTWQKQQTLFTSATLPNATHVLEVVVTGRKNPSSSGTLVNVDAFAFRATGGVTVDDRLADIAYAGSWDVVDHFPRDAFFQDSQNYYQDTEHRSTTAGASATWTFVGNSVSWIGPKNVDCGIAEVRLDGVLVATVDLFAPTWLKQQTLWTSAPLTQGPHTVQVTNTGTKNAASAFTYVTVDAFVQTSSGPTMVDDTSPGVTYTGTWNTAPSGGSPGYFNGTQHSSGTAGARAGFTFRGTSVTWIGPKNVDCGKGDVYLDGTKVATVDLYATSWLKQQDLWTSPTLADTTHTVEIVNTGTKNAAAIGVLVPVDAFRFVATGTDTVHNDTDGAIEYLSSAARTAVANGWPYWNLDLVGAGLICALGWPGQWGAQVTRTSDSVVRWTGGMVHGEALADGQPLSALGLTNLYLQPNEQIRTALVVMQPWNGGTAAAAQNAWRRWMLQYHVPRASATSTAPAQPLCPTQANDYFPGQHNTGADEITWMDAYGSHQATAGTGGIHDHWWIDAGWYTTPASSPTQDWQWTGTWDGDPARFPNMKQVTDRARQLGMKAIVWYEPERVMPGTYIANTFPGYLLPAAPGDGQWGGLAKLFNFGDPAALSWASGYFNNLITTQGVDFYREDFNIDPLPYWNTADPVNRKGIAQAKYVDGHLQFWAALRAAHPGMLIDTCASGGRRLDVLTLGSSINLLRSDAVRQATANQAHTAGLTPWVPLHGGAVLAIGAADDDYNLRSGMGPVYHEALAATDPAAPWTTLKSLAAEWAAGRSHYLADFHLLTPHSTSDDRWMVWQFGSASSGFLQAFRRPSSGAATEVVQARGLTPSRTYQLQDVRTGTTSTATGAALAAGLTLTLPTAPLATTIRYTGL
jgi:alpha-galactosidase